MRTRFMTAAALSLSILSLPAVWLIKDAPRPWQDPPASPTAARPIPLFCPAPACLYPATLPRSEQLTPLPPPRPRVQYASAKPHPKLVRRIRPGRQLVRPTFLLPEPPLQEASHDQRQPEGRV